MMQWRQITQINEWTGAVSVRYVAVEQTADRRARVYFQVYELGGRYYWSANIMIAHRPDLSRIAYGTYAAIPGALGVAKMRASRLGLAALRSCCAPWNLTRAA